MSGALSLLLLGAEAEGSAQESAENGESIIESCKVCAEEKGPRSKLVRRVNDIAQAFDSSHLKTLAEQRSAQRATSHQWWCDGAVDDRRRCGARTPRNQLFGELLEVSDQIFAVLLIFDAWEDHFGFRHKRNWIFKILEKVLL